MVGLYIFLAFVLVTIDLPSTTGSTQGPLATAILQTIPPVLHTIPPGCVHNGKMYAPQQSFSPSPCEHCMCTAGGRTACAIADCFFTPCADAIHDPKKCCPVCPNGENCKAPDGHIIKKGETYQPDPQTTCSCPTRFGFGRPQALCAVMPKPAILIDPVDQTVS